MGTADCGMKVLAGVVLCVAIAIAFESHENHVTRLDESIQLVQEGVSPEETADAATAAKDAATEAENQKQAAQEEVKKVTEAENANKEALETAKAQQQTASNQATQLS